MVQTILTSNPRHRVRGQPLHFVEVALGPDLRVGHSERPLPWRRRHALVSPRFSAMDGRIKVTTCRPRKGNLA